MEDFITRDEVLEQVADIFDNCPIMLGLYNRYFAKGVHFEVGRNRVVFMFKTYVVKLPFTMGGLGDNDWEGSVSNGPDSSPDDIQYARTRLYYKGEAPILFMELVPPIGYKALTQKMGKVPVWVDFVDCQQVGFNKHGKLVAFDYGLN